MPVHCMPLLSINLVKPSQTEASDIKQEMNDRIKANLEETYENTD